MAALAAGRAGARVILCDEDFRLGGRLLAEALDVGERSSARVGGAHRGGAGGAAGRAPDAAHHGVRRLRRRHLCRARARHRPPARAAAAPAAPAAVAHRRQALRAGGRRHRAAARVRRQRPPRRHAGGRRAHLCSTATRWRRAGSAVVFATSDETAGARRRPVAGRRRGGGDRRCRARRCRPASRLPPRRPARGCSRAAPSCGAIGAHAVRAVDVRTATGETERIACDLAGRVRRLEPDAASDLPSAAAGRSGTRRSPPSCRARCRQGMAVAGAANGRLGLLDAPRRRARAPGWRPQATAAIAGQPVDVPEVEPESTAFAPLWHVRGSQAKAFVDFQNDVTADDVALAAARGLPRVEHLKRYTTLGMATDQGKTSNVTGLALMAELTGQVDPADRHHHLPPALHAGRDRRARRPSSRQGVPPDAPAALARLGAGAGRGVRRDRPVAARAVLSASPARATGWRPSTARCGRCARASASAMSRRSARSTCRARMPATFLDRLYINTLSTLAVGRARYGVMLREDGFVLDDGTTSRLGRAPLHHDHDDGQRRQGAAAHGVLPPGAVAGARRAVRLGHRAVGAVLRRRARCARDVLRGVVDPQLDISNAAFPFMAAAEVTRAWAASRRACSASRSRASSPTRSRCRRATATR